MFRFLGLLVILLLALAGWGYANITADPVLHRIAVSVEDWPRNTAPLRIALIGDVHVQGPDMPPERVARIVEQVNAQRPDLVLIAGDLVGDRKLGTRDYSDAEIAAPLGRLVAPLGVHAVLGNHDHWRDGPGMRKALEGVGITVLANSAERVGVLTLVGIDDIHSEHADIARAERAAAALPGPVVVLSHSPDVVPRLSRRFPVILAAHTHCGQIVLPHFGQVVSASGYGDRYRCGAIRENGRAVIVTGGLGASVLPLRFGAPPDWWLVTLGGPRLAKATNRD